jgi:hypothetical protein
LAGPCGASDLADVACHPVWGHRQRGGVNALHPRNPDTWEHLREVGGVEFDDVIARRQLPIALPPFVQLVRPRKVLRDQLADSVYVVGPGVAARKRIPDCDTLRKLTRLRPHQRLGLLLFGQDRLLEWLWPRRADVADQIAAAGFDFCVSPSYSNYTGRPRPEFLFNVKRALVFFQLLQSRGIPTIARAAWVIERDVERFAKWTLANPAIESIALDLASSSARHWARELELLRLFDDSTGRCLSYLIHGPSVIHRCVDLYRLIEPGRICISNSRGIARPALAGTPYAERFATEKEIIDAARRVVDAESVSGPTTHPPAHPSTEAPA